MVKSKKSDLARQKLANKKQKDIAKGGARSDFSDFTPDLGPFAIV